MTTVKLRRLLNSVENGAWGTDPGVAEFDVQCVRAADFDFDRLRVDLANAPTRGLDARTWDRLRLKPGDIVLEKSGGGEAAPVGRAVMFDDNTPAVTSNFAARVRPRTGVDSRFLVYILRSLYDSGVTLKCIKQTTGIQNLDTEHWLQSEVPSPPLDEQQRIADFLDDRVARIDQIITARRRQAIKLTDATRRAVMDRLLHPWFAQAGTAPWFEAAGPHSSIRLSNRWTVIDCKHRTPAYQDSGYPVISPGDISPGRLDLGRATRFVSHEDYVDLADDLRRCRQGDLVYSRNASAGTAAYVDTPDPFTMGQDVCRITSPRECQLYLAYCLNYLTTPQLDSARVGSTFTRINVEQIKALVVPYREPPEQVDVAAACDELVSAGEERRSALLLAVDLLQEYKQSLITAAVTGELDVTTAGSGIPGVRRE